MSAQNITPWMDKKEIALIESFLTPETVMLEWGSGGSTHYFSKLVKKYFSIEHNQKWYKKTLIGLPENVVYRFIPANNIVDPRQSTYQDYKKYIDTAISFNMKFDVILIDGRARVACAMHAVALLNPGGVIFVHDFWKRTRARYRCLLDHFTEIASIKDTVQTIIALRPENDTN